MRNRKITIAVSQTCKTSQQIAFEAIAPIDLKKIFTGYAFFPGVVGVRNYPGHWDEAGLSRIPVFSDGSIARETLVTYDPPVTFSYKIVGFTNIFKYVVYEARGKWAFSSTADGLTRIEWTYEFYPRQGMRPLLRFGIAPFWKKYMQRALQSAISLQYK